MVSIASTERKPDTAEGHRGDPMRPVIEAQTIQTVDGSPHARSHRVTARLVGGLFILATAAGVASVVLQQPVIDAPNYLSEAHRHEGRLATGALLEMVMSAAVVAIAITIYPVLTRFRARLAIGYVVARAVEATMYLIGSVGLLTVLTLSRTAAEGSSAVGLGNLGDLVLAQRDVTGALMGTAAFSVSAVILNVVLLRTRLVPRWLSAWGLAAATFYLAGGVLGVYGPDPASVTQTVLDLPLAVQEMVLAAWLVIRGFTQVAGCQRQ
jgi:Domain of unknown function (DUF4386)